MIGVDHEHNASVEEAAAWLAEQNPLPHPAVPALRARFGLTAVEACEACSLAQALRGRTQR